jgi:formamidopyrimidine-DNA glycosylase
MPELPEVETVVRTLAPKVVGRRIVEVRAMSPHVVPAPLDAAAGRSIQAVRRRGKHILMVLDRGLLDIHLGMTGSMRLGARPGPYTRAWFRFDRGSLAFDDPRQFGRIQWGAGRAERLGPEPFDIAPDDFRLRLAGRRTAIKPLLLNQRFLAGVGNIYADESLFRARIHPRAPAGRIGRARALRLHAAIVGVLNEAIARGGASVSDYVDAEGRAGTFQEEHCVYGRKGQPCPACGSPIRRIELAQRGTHYCPRCQRA